MDNAVKVYVDDINSSTNTITIKLDHSDIAKAVGRDSPYRSLPSKFAPALEKVGDYFRTVMIPRVFQQEGPGWAQLAPRTVWERQQQGFSGKHPILFRSGDLYKELTEKSHPNHIEIIKVGKYSRIEIGGSSVKFIQNQLGKGDPGQRLPKRSMVPGTGNIPVDDKDRAQIKDILLKAIENDRV